MSQDQGSRSPFMDTFLTALMGLGIGELQFYTTPLFHIDSSTTLLAGNLIRVARAVVQNVMMDEVTPTPVPSPMCTCVTGICGQ